MHLQACDENETDDSAILRIVGRLDKHEALKISRRYKDKYDKDLSRVLEDEVGGNLGKALNGWITFRDPTNDLEYNASLVNSGSPQILELAKCISRNAKVL